MAIPHLRTIAAAGLLALLCGAGTARAGFNSGAGVGEPTLLRLTGFIGAPPPGATTLGTVTLGVDHTVATFHLAAVQTLNGALTEGRAALRQTELYNPNLLLAGKADLLRRITSEPPQTKLTLFGYLSGTRRLVVVQVDAS
jgi:hypothetical protein